MSDPREIDRIRAEYDRRASDHRYDDLYSSSNPAMAQAVHEREEAMLQLLGAGALGPLDGLSVVDVGCGVGAELRRLFALGVLPSRSTGVDLMPSRIEAAVSELPGTNFVVSDAACMPFDDDVFDLALMFTVLSSVLDPGLRLAIATEVARILKPGGGLLWYDFYWNPVNRQTTGIGPREMRRLFPGFDHRSRKVTLAPPIARAVAPRAPGLARALARVPLLRSHTIGLAVKPRGMP